MLEIEGQRFQITLPLGVGSYGMVWSARRENGDSVAIKEIWCNTTFDLENANFEGELLYRLGMTKTNTPAQADELANMHMTPPALSHSTCNFAINSGRDTNEASYNILPDPRVPALVARACERMSENEWRVRLAMTLIPGDPLMVILDQHRQEQQEQEALHQAQRSNIQTFEEALEKLSSELAQLCFHTHELIAQLGPTLERMSAQAIHRDVNPRNILLDLENEPSYGLVDFGMATDASMWCAESGSWQHLDVGGDCRYWPLSAWTMFLHGPSKLVPCRALQMEYRMLLDIHALGITGIQFFVEMLPGLLEPIASSEREDDFLARLRMLRAAWERYWEHASDFWSCLIKCFNAGGDWEKLKIACFEHNVVAIVRTDLVSLRETLRELSVDASSSLPAALKRDLRIVFRTLRAMISTAEDEGDAPSWMRVCEELKGTGAEGFSDGSMSLGAGAARAG